MPVSFSADEEHDLLTGSTTGLVREEEFLAAVDKVLHETEGAAFYQNLLFTIEHDSVLTLLDLQALFHIRRLLEDWGEKYPGRDVRTVFLVTDPEFHSGIVKVWEAVTREASNFVVEIRIMTNRSQALAWLKEPRRASA